MCSCGAQRFCRPDYFGNLTSNQGHILTYDKNGNRLSDTQYGRQVVETPRPYAADENGTPLLDENGNLQYGYDEAGRPLGPTIFTIDLGPVTQTYTYDAQNRVSTVSHRTVDANGQPVGSGQLLDTRRYDKAGRLVQDGPTGPMNWEFVRALTGEELVASGIASRKNRYNAAGQLINQQAMRADGFLNYEVIYDDIDAMGNVRSKRIVAAGNTSTQTYTHTYEKRDSYLEKKVHGSRSDNPNAPSESFTTYDVNGHIRKVSETLWQESSAGFPDILGISVEPGHFDNDGTWVPPTLSLPGTAPDIIDRNFVTDANGIVLHKSQQGNNLKQLVVQGQVVSTYGRGTDPDKQLNDDGTPNYADQGSYGLTYDEINNRNAGGSSAYTVQAGDTLARLAQGLWGDASLWYRIADANGLSALGPDTALTVGQKISIPNVLSSRNTAQTFNPYDAGSVVGDTTPNMPSPPSDDGCGMFGQIIMIVVFVVVAIWAPYALPKMAPLYTAMASAAMASVASQVVGIAIGAQEDACKGRAWAAACASVAP